MNYLFLNIGMGISFVAVLALFIYLFIKLSDFLKKRFPKAFPEGAKDLFGYLLVFYVAVAILAIIGEGVRMILPLLN